MKLIKFAAGLIIFVALFAIKANIGAGVFAATIDGFLDNRSGAIPVTVTVNYYRSDNNYVSPAVVQTVAAGARTYVTKTDSSDSPPYRITWSTACNYGSQNNITGSGGVYTFPDQNVHCTQPNANVSISTASCPANSGSVAWNVTNIGSNGANIDYFKIYRSTGDPEGDSSPFNVDYVSGTTAYSQNLGNMAVGVWNVKVKAYTNTPDSNFVADVAVMNCGAGLTPAGALGTNITCDTNQIRVDFSWGAAQSGTFNYLVQTNANTDPGYNGTWAGNSFTPNPQTITIVTGQGSFNTSTTYYWRVKATRTSDSAVVYSASSNFTTPSTCSSGNIQAPSIRDPNAMANVCAPDINYNWDKMDDSWALPANPDKVAFRWQRAVPYTSIVANQEFIEVSTDSTFLSGVTAFNVYDGAQTTYSAGKTVNYAFPDNTDMYWRVKTKMTDGNYYFSQVKPFRPLSSCTDVPHAGNFIPHIADMFLVQPYCLGTDSVVRFSWKTDVHGIYPYLRFVVNRPGYSAINSFTIGYNDEWVANNWGANFWTYTWSASVYMDNGYGQTIISSQTVNFTVPNCAQNGTVSTPDGLDSVPTMSCTGAEPSIVFKWTDRSNNETAFILDVSSEPFTGDGTTNPSSVWGRKSVAPQGGSQPSQIGFQHQFVWTRTTGELDIGDANPADTNSANDKVPLDGTIYYWRVRAYVNTTTYSAFRYPDGADNDPNAAGTVYAAGAPFTVTPCTPKYDLSLATADGGGFKNWNKQDFEADGNVGDTSKDGSIEITVVNRAGTGIQTLPANSGVKLNFYYKGNQAAPNNIPSCTASPTSNIPVDGAGVQKQITINDAIDPGSSRTYTITWDVGVTVGNAIAQAYVVPNCAYSIGTEPTTGWANNQTTTGFTYTIGVDKYFISTGGDVGAKGKVSVGVNSTDASRTVCAPNCVVEYQSDYLLAGGDLPDNTDSDFAKSKASPAGFRIDNYNGNYVNSGVYSYFYNRFRGKATNNLCSSSNTISAGTLNVSGLNYCTGKVTIGGDVTISGSGVLFVDNGDLDIRGNITNANANSGIVFVVGGNIIVNYDFTSARFIIDLNGIYIARDTFYDSGIGNGGSANVSGGAQPFHRLQVVGAVYADGINGPGFDLSRFFFFSSAVTNKRWPADIFVYDPKYMILLSTLLSTTPVGWDEAAP